MNSQWLKIGAIGCATLFGVVVILIALVGIIVGPDEPQQEAADSTVEYVPAERTEVGEEEESTAEPEQAQETPEPGEPEPVEEEAAPVEAPPEEEPAEEEPDIFEEPLEDVIEEPEIEVDARETPEERVEEILGDAFGGGFLGSGEYDRLRSVDVAGERGDFLVTVNYDSRATRDGDLFEMADIMEALYTSNMGIAEVRTVAHGELVDTQTGEEFEEVVWRTLLDRNTADGINWENSMAIEWGNVLVTEYVHPVRAG